MRIVQLVTNLSDGDAIGNDILAIHRTLSDEGYSCEMMAQTIHPRLADQAQSVDLTAMSPSDLLIFHKATGDQFTSVLKRLTCRKVLIYHNITPARYYLPYDEVMAWNLWRGRRQLCQLSECMDCGWGDSVYNCQELVAAGFPRDKVFPLPILFETELWKKAPDQALLKKLNQKRGAKLLFIGRIVPNKKQEDVIKVFYHYLRMEDSNATLYLIGSWEGMEKYYAKLRGFAADLGLTEEQVVFTGHVSEAEKTAYLMAADALVCMSEHEGFCVPLLEAMFRDIPVAAFASSAIPETLGNNGLLFERKEYSEIARQIGRLRRDAVFREKVLEKQRNIFRRFDEQETRSVLLTLVKRALGKEETAE